MVKKYLIWPIRLFLYCVAILLIIFYSFCLLLTTEYGSRQTSYILFGDNIDFKKISVRPSLLGMEVEMDEFSFTGAANFSGDQIMLEINFLNSVVGDMIYIPKLQLLNTKVSLNESENNESESQPNIFIKELSVNGLRAGDTDFKKLELNDFLLEDKKIGFAFNGLKIDLPGSIRSLDQFSGKGYFFENNLSLKLDSKEVIIDFKFYEAPSIFKNLNGIIEIDFNDKFKIPYAKISSKQENRNIKTSFKYNDFFSLELWMKGNESEVNNLIPSNANNVKNFLKDSRFKSDRIDLLLTFSDINDISTFSSLIKTNDSSIKLSEIDFATDAMNLYLDNSSLRIFGENLNASNLALGNIFISKKLTDDSAYSLVLNDYNNFNIEIDNEGVFKSLNGSITTNSQSRFNVSFNDKRLLLNMDEIYFEFNILDNYEITSDGIKFIPTESNSNYLLLDNTLVNSFEFNISNMELKNINANFKLLKNNANLSLNPNLEFESLLFGLKNSYVKFQNPGIAYGGLVNISGKDISYSDSTFSIDALRVLSLIDIRSRLLNILNADFNKLDQNNFFINDLSGEFFVDSSGYANINKLNLNFDVGNAALAGTISTQQDSFDTFDLEMDFNSTLSQNIPWYVAILGGFPAAAGAVVVTGVLEDGINQITETKYSISGNAENLVVEPK